MACPVDFFGPFKEFISFSDPQSQEDTDDTAWVDFSSFAMLSLPIGIAKTWSFFASLKDRFYNSTPINPRSADAITRKRCLCDDGDQQVSRAFEHNGSWTSNCPSHYFPTPLDMSAHITVQQHHYLQSQSPLLRLPVEIRFQIFEYLLTGSTNEPERLYNRQRKSIIEIGTQRNDWPLGFGGADNQEVSTRLAIIFGSRQIYLEARTVLYEANDFVFEIQHHTENQYYVGCFAQTIGPSSCSMIRHISFTVSFPNKEWFRVLFATLPYFTNLRECKIAIWLPGDRKGVLRQMIANFVEFGGEWLVENKKPTKVLWPSSAFPIYPLFL